MERAFVVFLALASISPTAEALDSAVQDFRTLCQKAQSPYDCAVIANNLGSIYFSTGRYREAETMFARAISLWAAETAPSDDLAKAYHNLGDVYRAEGWYANAASLYESALE